MSVEIHWILSVFNGTHSIFFHAGYNDVVILPVENNGKVLICETGADIQTPQPGIGFESPIRMCVGDPQQDYMYNGCRVGNNLGSRFL